MRKFLTILIALALAMSMSVTAFAEGGSSTQQNTGDQSIDVTAKYNQSSSTQITYSVAITWESMTFTYTESGTRIWDPETHTYTTSTTSGWDKTEADITVVNHSNAPVTATVTYTPVDGNGVTGTVVNGTKTLKAGTVDDPDNADSLVATLQIGGKPNSTVSEDGVKVGTITVTIEK